MKNLLHPGTAAEIINRIEQINPGSSPLWGKMNAGQMLAHCQVPMEVALGDRQMSQSFAGFLFGRIARKRVLSNKRMARNLPTLKSFVVPDERNLNKERSRLIDLVKRFAEGGATGITSGPHPFFGKLSQEEWGLLSYIHLDHHLQQFGV